MKCYTGRVIITILCVVRMRQGGHFFFLFQLGKVWGDIQPIIDNLQGPRPDSPARLSPVGSPTSNNHPGITA